MAERITYTPPPPSPAGAAAEVDELVAALHESGLLRALTGAVRAHPRLLGLAAEHVDADRLRTVVALGGLTGVVGPDGAERLVEGARAATAAAEHALADDPPSLLALARSLNDPDVRRGAGALVAALGALGATLAE